MNTDRSEYDDSVGIGSSVRKFVNETVAVALAKSGCLLDPNDLKRPRNPGTYTSTHTSVSLTNCLFKSIHFIH